MRGNKDSVMAMLEAFAYDPLISWRLLVPEAGDASRDAVGGARDSVGDGEIADKITDHGIAEADVHLDSTIKSVLTKDEADGVEVVLSVKDGAGGARRVRQHANEPIDNNDGNINARYSAVPTSAAV